MESKRIENFKDLRIWQESIVLVEGVYAASKGFPKEELYGITSQMRRSAVSIPSNIAEGFMRKHPKEFKQFLFIALGSAAELETQLTISANLGYLDKSKMGQLAENIDKINRMIMTLAKKL
ncbi:MAG: four helix bundle protein [Candidatus Omnitrophota bacterium]